MIRLIIFLLCLIYLLYFYLETKRISDIFILEKGIYIRQFLNLKGYIHLFKVRKAKSKTLLAKFLAKEMEIALLSLDERKIYIARTHLLKLFKFGERRGNIEILKTEYLYDKNIILESLPFASFSFLKWDKKDKIRAFYKIEFRKNNN